MRKMVWDELATVAQRHADQMQVRARRQSDRRRVDRFELVRTFIYKQVTRLPKTKWNQAVTDWYDEVALSAREVEPFKFSAAIGHFSQLVWADTDKVGCGATHTRMVNGSLLYTCNYGPNGNYIRGQMYKQGFACSDCPGNTVCSKEYPWTCESGSGFVAPVFKPPLQSSRYPRSPETCSL